MKPLKVPREVWTFTELRDHFRISDLDVKRMVMAGLIRPAAHFARELYPMVMEGGSPVSEAEDPIPVRGWLWVAQEQAERFDTFNCNYFLWRDRPLHDDTARYFSLPDPMTLDQLLVFAVVLNADVVALEESQKEDPDREMTEREEKTRDKLLATMAAELLKWKPGEKADFVGLTDLCDASKAYGIGFSYNAAKEHLWRAWERAKPKALEGKPALIG